MISKNNYFSISAGINIPKLPEALQKGHSMVERASKNGSDWAMYDKSDTIRKTVDLYFEMLASHMENKLKEKTAAQEKKSAPKVTVKKTRIIPTRQGIKAEPVPAEKVTIRTNPSIPQKTLKRAEKAVKAVKSAKAKKYRAPVAYQDHFNEAETVVKAFVNMNGRVKTEKQVKALLDKVNKFVVERKIRKTSPYAAAIKVVQDRLEKALKAMKAEGVTRLDLDFTERTLSLLQKFAKQSKIFTSVQLLKRFIPMMGTAPDKAKAKKLLTDITRGMEKGGISASDTYYGIVKEAAKDLTSYLNGSFKQLSVDSPALSGLGSLPEFAGLGCPGEDCGCPDKKPLAGLPKKGGRSTGKKPTRR